MAASDGSEGWRRPGHAGETDTESDVPRKKTHRAEKGENNKNEESVVKEQKKTYLRIRETRTGLHAWMSSRLSTGKSCGIFLVARSTMTLAVSSAVLHGMKVKSLGPLEVSKVGLRPQFISCATRTI